MATRERGTVSDEFVRKATGRGWDEWLAALDAAGLDALRALLEWR